MCGAVAIEFMTRNGIWIIPIINSLMLLGGLLLIYGAIRSFSHQRTTVVIYFMAWGSLFAGYLIMTASEFGVFPVEDLPVNPVLVGSSLEIFIFSIGLTYQIRKIYNERNLLSLSMAKQQKELLKAYVEGTEKERERIARELHDDIGSRLGSLKRFIDSKQRNVELENQIDIICRDVRTMSHQLAPPSMQVSGLRQLVQQLTEETSKQTGINIEAQYYDLPDTMHGETVHHLFRIVQEGLNNIVKHAQASEVDLQFFVHENELVLTIEDNGRGFDTSKNASGIGLQNMKVRTESLNGHLDISSQPGNGTHIMIRIPMPNTSVPM
ncbi:MAG: sensor histidine kinase [Cytophagia bacterium]|nr:sensor histidine kinase [Cytophagia bacterium]